MTMRPLSLSSRCAAAGRLPTAQHSMTSSELHACRCPPVNFARCKRHATPAPPVTRRSSHLVRYPDTPVEQCTTAYGARCVSCRSWCWLVGPEGLVSSGGAGGGAGRGRHRRGEHRRRRDAARAAHLPGPRHRRLHPRRRHRRGARLGPGGESWTVKEELAAYGADPDWFGLGDRDLATHLIRTRMLDAGYPLSAVTAALADRWQPGVTVLPMSDQRVETHVVVDRPGDRPPARHPLPGVVGAAPRRARRLGLRAGRRGRRPPRPRRGRGLRRRRRRAAGAVQPGGVRSARSSASRACARRCSPPRPASPASPRSSAAPSCAAWPTAACRCSASRSAPRAWAATTAPAPTAACSTPGSSHPRTRADVPGVDVRQVPLLMSDPDATTALARAALDAAGV